MDRTIRDDLMAIAGSGQVLTDEPLSRHTSFRIGGPADLFVTPADEETLRKVLLYCKDRGIDHYIMGNGSNLLVRDGGYRGVVIQLWKNFGSVAVDGERIHAQAGAMLSGIAKTAQKEGLTGFEFASGIPGTLGGGTVMNAGAYGGELKQVIETVRVMDPSGDIKELSCEEMQFGYRTSVVVKEGYLVLKACLRLERGDPEQILQKMEELKEARTQKQPLELPSAGSTFKRPEGYFAGKLIMDAGLRGYSVGGAMVSTKHCGFVVNTGGATAKDVCTLMKNVQEKVFEQFGVMLEPEVKMLGEE